MTGSNFHNGFVSAQSTLSSQQKLSRDRVIQEGSGRSPVLVPASQALEAHPLGIRYQTLSELTSDYAFSCRMEYPEGCVVMEWLTEAFTRVTGYSVEEINTPGWQMIVPPEDWAAIHAHQERLKQNEPSICEHRVVTKSATTRWLRSYARPTEQDAQGRVVRFIGAAQDITERKAMEEALRRSEERFRAAVQAIGDILWTNSPQGEMTGEQPDWGAFTGQTQAEYEGYGWAIAVHPDDAQPTLDAWNEAVRERRMFLFEHRVRRYDGVWRLFAIRAVPVLNRDGSIREWVGVHTDITEPRAREEQIEALNAQLRRAMTETHHRVKNNLQLVSALIELLRDNETGMVSIEELARLESNIQAMGTIHDILTQQSRAGSDQVTLPTRAVLEKMLDALAPTLGNHRLTYTVEDVRLGGRQATSLAIIANELVANAVKHGSSQTQLQFTTNDQNAFLDVRDNGPGFPAGFDAAHVSRVGLELVENIARWDLNGTVNYSNDPEGGAHCVIAFPLSESD